MIYEQMILEQKKIEEEIESLENQIKHLPEGELIAAKNSTGYKYYVTRGGKKEYVSARERKFIDEMVNKKYVKAKIQELENEKKSIDSYVNQHQKCKTSAEDLLMKEPYDKYLLKRYTPESEKTQAWLKEPYKRCEWNPELLNQKTLSGNMVRSKSEAIIDMILTKNKIPFKYECALPIGDTVYYPDFTIMHPKTKQIYYWEHFGMMDNLSYTRHAFNKLEVYNCYGIIPSINLITTFETKDNPLTADFVEKLIKLYF